MTSGARVLAGTPCARLLALAAAGGFVGSVGCASDAYAPNDYVPLATTTDSAGTDTAGVPSDLALACGQPKPAAVEAEYEYLPARTGGVGPFRFEATAGLPPGLDVDEATGRLGGVPTMAARSTVEITVTDTATGATATTTCDVEVRPKLAVDFSLREAKGGPTKVEPCVVKGDDLADFVVGGSGDGSPLSCTVETGQGNGRVPSGISVNEASCAIEGDVTGERYGVFSWIVAVEQAGAKVYVPFCAVEDEAPMDAYDIDLTLGGRSSQELVAAHGTFRPGQPLAWGGVGGDPLFTVRGPCDVACFFEFVFSYGATFFDSARVSADPSTLLREMGVPVGFTHVFTAGGEPVPAPFDRRPFVMNVDFDYCLDDVEATCRGADNIRQNGRGSLAFSLVMTPE